MSGKRKRTPKAEPVEEDDADEEDKKAKKRSKTEPKAIEKTKADVESEGNDAVADKKGKKPAKAKNTKKGKKDEEEEDEGDDGDGGEAATSVSVTVTEAGPTYGAAGADHFKIISWNVNSIRACQKNKEAFTEYVKREQPDVICIQETKVNAASVPKNIAPGYKEFWCHAEKNGYAGTAVFSKTEPISITYGLGIKEHDTEGRTITVEYDTFYLVNTYIPNSGAKLERLAYRTKEWDTALLAHLKKLEEKKPIIWTGDLNVAHDNIDLANPDTNHKTAGFTNEERANFTKLLGSGFVDTYRQMYPKEKKFSFWTYKRNSRQSNVGWRLDYFVVSSSFLPRVKDSFMRSLVMGSDHCPIGLLLTKK